ncbi:MAG: hypothetical protein CK529_14500 [Rhodospirillaceae bacterium]|nr:MAG: hypothetical protein CK529_14500 [Rhodospirillaceae bacterium]
MNAARTTGTRKAMDHLRIGRALPNVFGLGNKLKRSYKFISTMSRLCHSRHEAYSMPFAAARARD